ncbi:terminase large subunit [Bacteroides salyersiae]|jgi:phage terminase large subunit-like protein|uniref:terminase large subunit n=1 Tax=Bacteroides salyersiae TaxID=291644 RepID=UPI00101B7D85|nr:terminase TerL endonuclease subunit [Bacteroides salyersiae]DAE60888.1 MAG TPA: Large Terminase [Caudoviricetes sp.]
MNATTDITNTTYYQYIEDVLNNKVIACKSIKLACNRFLSFLEKDEYYFDDAAVQRVINFISLIRHYLGKHNGKPFILQPWQTLIIASVYGFRHKKDDTRVCRNAFILMARKNGKSALCAALSLYHLIADNEAASEIFFAANSREQAKILLSITSNFAKSLDAKGKTISVYRDLIKFKNNFIKVVSSDTSKLDGYNLSFAIIDEEHEAKDSKMIDIISSSMGMRTQPLLIEISTAGFNTFGICKEKYNTCKEILNGLKEDDSLQAFIFELDESDNWDDKTTWIKANPNLDITVTTDFIQSEITKAKNTSSLEVSVRTKNLNQWLSSSEIWIADIHIINATQKLKIEDFAGFNCYVGVDLSAVSDLTAVSFLIDMDDKYYFFNKYYIPESALSDNSNSELYKRWQRMGLLTITEGNVTDYDYITADLMRINQIVTINSIAYDTWNSTQWAIDATSKGLPLQPFSQALGNFNRATKEFERLILSNKIAIDDNEITRYCFRNVSLKFDHNDNCKPVKSVRQNKIDGVIGMLEALGIMLQEPQYNNEIFSL